MSLKLRIAILVGSAAFLGCACLFVMDRYLFGASAISRFREPPTTDTIIGCSIALLFVFVGMVLVIFYVLFNDYLQPS